MPLNTLTLRPQRRGHGIAPLARRLSLGLALVLTVLPGCAQPQRDAAPPGGRRGPPPEALAACEALKADATCRFTSPHGELSGRCWAPKGKPLACRPDGAPEPGATGSPSSGARPLAGSAPRP